MTMLSLKQDLLPWFKNHLKADLRDKALEGLQIESHDRARKIAFAVSTDLATLYQAALWGADALIVHHGLFWPTLKGPLRGINAKRLGFLFEHKINLIAAHLSLDIHPLWGNNVGLGRSLGWTGPFEISHQGLLYQTLLPEQSFSCLFHLLKQHFPQIKLSFKNCDFDDSTQRRYRVAWCTGAGGDFISDLSDDVDLYLTGEVSERCWTEAAEMGLALATLGHDMSEIFGVLSLKEALESEFSERIETLFIPPQATP